MNQKVDVIIAGAGLSGLLSLLHLSRQHPEWTFALLEREPWIGGRMRPTLQSEGSRSCGLHVMGVELFDHFMQTFGNAMPENLGDQVYPCQSIGILNAQKISHVPLAQALAPIMAKTIGGVAATKDWSMVERLLEKSELSGDDTDLSWNQAWKGDKKSGALIVLEHLMHLLGIPELSSASLKTMKARAFQLRAGLWTGRWDLFFAELLAELCASEKLSLMTMAQIMAARYEEGVWQVASTRGVFYSERLLVAQSPWEAVQWLPKELWPTRLLNLASKTKPVSLVILSDRIQENSCERLSDMLLIPAEEVQVVVGQEHICYQATLPFELTVQAPAVVKAVKRLKRAKKKLQAALPGFKGEGDHIALLPVGWVHASSPQDQRWFDKLDIAQNQKKHLSFCGESYGSEGDSERNLIHSVRELVRAWE